VDNSCDCKNCGCQDPKRYTPVRIYNASGQPSISYRIGTHAVFKADMLLSISSQPALKELKTREDSDLSIGLMDSWALVADVLTFYQERIANEGFLRTATERRSLLELARSIGYELKPGVAARAYLAFLMDTAASSPNKATIGIGTKVQSVPAQGESPQVFETMEEIEAQKVWNEIKPQREEQQDLQAALAKGEVLLAGTSTKLTVGDGLFFIIAGGTKAAFVIVNHVVIETAAASSRTRILFAPTKAVDTEAIEKAGKEGVGEEVQTDSVLDSQGLLSQSDIREIIGLSWTESHLQSKATIKGWSMDKIVEAINSERKTVKVTGDAVYAFRVKCGVVAIDSVVRRSDISLIISLDNIYHNVQRDNWIILKKATMASAFYVADTAETNEAIQTEPVTISVRVTGLNLDKNKWIPQLYKRESDSWRDSKIEDDLKSFKKKNRTDKKATSVYAAPEELELADYTIETPVEGKEILLDRMIGGLGQGRPISVSGELEDQPGILRKEIAFLSNVVHFEEDKMLTKLYLSEPLAYKYKRSTVKINANVARSTHGETKEVSLGSGDPTQKFQEFVLKHSPLTHISGATASGAKSTLEVSVDRIKWEEKESFEGMGYSERAFITRRSDDGKTTVIFGDGATGRLPSSGQENVKAKYRIGIGSDGLLEADQLSILMTRPLGVRGVTNPLKTSGAEDPESLDEARRNAPRTVLTMDRIVSLRDYQNFAQGYAGIGKATSYMVRIGGDNVVLVAVSAEGGEELDVDHRKTLAKAIELHKDPAAQFTVRSFQPRAFNVDAKLIVSRDRVFDNVKTAVEIALKEAFSFETRSFGQAVTISEVISTIQGVEGVEAVDIEYLYEHTSAEDGAGAGGGGLKVKKKEDMVRAAGKEDADGVVIPSVLFINEDGITLEEKMIQQP
jgi:hypothetical protein